ncbi:MAG: DinB family protein [Planctomycetota bacterium]
MNPARIIARLDSHQELWRSLLSGLDESAVRRVPPEGGWSVLVLVAHLADEERDDFRARSASVLSEPAAPWPPIDPEGWVTSRRYAERSWPAVLEDFLVERRRSIEWLKSRVASDWSLTHQHPSLGPIRAGDLLASWLAHDLRHLSQAARLLHGALANDAAPYSVAYAG